MTEVKVEIYQIRQEIADTEQEMRMLLQQMQGVTDNKDWQVLNDRRYELRQQKQSLQMELTELVKNNRKGGKW